MSEVGKEVMDRRRFLKAVGALSGVAALSGLAAACGSSAPGAAPTALPAAQATKPASAPAAATSAPAAAAPAAGGKAKVARVVSINPAGGSSEKAAQEFAKWMKDRSKGELDVQVFFGGQLGGERDMVESAQLASIEICVFGDYLINNVAQEWGGVLSMPYFITSQEKFRGVVDGPLSKPMYDAMLERKGLRHIAWENRGPRYLTSNKPVSIPADLKGIKIRVPEVEMSMAAWKMLGAIVTPMAFPEVFMALKQGTIDAQENPYELIYGSSFFEVQKYLNQTAHLRSGYEVVVSEKWFKTLSPELQKTVSDGLVEMAKLQDKMQAEDEAGYETKMKDKGMIFNPVQLDKFQEALVDLPKQFQSKWMPGFFEDVQKFVK